VSCSIATSSIGAASSGVVFPLPSFGFGAGFSDPVGRALTVVVGVEERGGVITDWRVGTRMVIGG
jgi:hypothetical protein